jgi:hypothetical protein
MPLPISREQTVLFRAAYNMLSTKKSAIAGSWSYHQRNINADSRILSQQSSLSVELPSALHTTFHRGPRFDRWMLLAQADHQLWVDPKFKDPFSAWLDQYQIAQPGQHSLQASQGNVHLSTSVFIWCLSEAGCDTIQLKAYGQKTPIDGGFVHQEPAEVHHQWATHNE